MKKYFFISILFLYLLCFSEDTQAQCAMCKLNAENNTAEDISKAKGVNNGILLLLASPYLAMGVIGFVWYKKYKKKSQNTDEFLVDDYRQ